MFLTRSKIFYGWFVVAGSALVVFGVGGSEFSFGVFLKPMTEEFGWSRATLSLAFGTTFVLSGLLWPVAGYLADRFSPKTAALSGTVLMAAMLLLLPLIDNLIQLYLIFAVMSVGIAFASGPVLTKVVTAWFHQNRGMSLGIVNGGGAVGAMVLVPAASLFLVLFEWREAYIFLGLTLLLLIGPAGYLLIRNRPQDLKLRALGEPTGPSEQSDGATQNSGIQIGDDVPFGDALRTGFFWRLTFGYFV